MGGKEGSPFEVKTEGKKCLERSGQGTLPVQNKRELGKVKKGRLRGSKDHVGGSQPGLFGSSQADLGMSRVLKNKRNSVSKIGGVPRSLVKSRDSSRRKRDRQGSFLSPLHSTKRQGQTSSNNRPFSLKQTDKEKRPKDARPQVSPLFNRTRYVGSKTGFKGCLLPHSPPSFDLEVLQVLPEKERKPSKGLLLQKNAFWSNNGSLGVHKDPSAPIKGPKTSRDHSVRLFGRFFDPSSLQGGSLKRHRGGNKAVAGSWIQNKLGQVLGGTSQDCRILRSSNKSGRPDIQSPRREGTKNPSDISILSRARSHLKEISGRDGRLSYLRRKLPEMGKAFVKTSPKLDECQHFSHPEGPLGAGGRALQASLSALVKGGVPPSSNFICGEKSLERDYDRRLRGGLVRGHPTHNPVGGLAGAMENPVNELERVEGNPSVSISFQGRSRGFEGES